MLKSGNEYKYKVSVIVPIYNVENFLKECLDSIVDQTLEDIEVIMVNDGSLDNSAAIAKEYENKYNNFTLYNKVNGGLGQARNYGINLATGEYLAFVDSDDIIHKEMLCDLYNKGSENGSEIVTSNVTRFTERNESGSRIHDLAGLNIEKDAVSLSENLELLFDTTSWNKIYLRSFWEENNFSFPEGILYEDIPVMLPAYLVANNVSVCNKFFYRWRIREGSITNTNNNIVNFYDRIEVLRRTMDFYSLNSNSQAILSFLEYKILLIDYPIFIENFYDKDVFYQKEIFKLIKEEIDFRFKYFDDVVSQLPLKLQKIYNLIKNSNIKFEELQIKVKLFLSEEIINDNIEIQQDKYIYTDNNIRYDITKDFNNSKVISKVEKVSMNNRFLTIEGYGFKKLINVGSNVKIKSYLVFGDEKIEVKSKLVRKKYVTYRNSKSKIINNLTLSKENNYDYSGYEVKIPLKVIKRIQNNSLQVKNVIFSDNSKFEYLISGPIKGAASRPDFVVDYYKGDKISIKYNSMWELCIRKYKINSTINDISIIKNNIILKGETNLLREQLKDYKLVVVNWKKGTNIELPLKISRNKIQASISIDQLTNMNSKYYIHLKQGNTTYDLPFHTRYIDNIKAEFIKFGIDIDITNNDNISLEKKTTMNYLINVEKINNKIRLHIKTSQPKPILKIKAKLSTINIPLYNTKNGVNIYDIELSEINLHKLNMGFWSIRLNDSPIKTCVVKDITYSKNTFQFLKNTESNTYIYTYSKKSFLTNGPRRTMVTELNIYPIFNKLPLRRKNVFFESYWGKEYSDNPRYISEYLSKNHPDYKLIWGLNDTTISTPDNVVKVQRPSIRYYYYIATSSLLFNNVNFFDNYEKRSNSIEVQTMHGIPIKTLGFDNIDDFNSKSTPEKYKLKIERWDYLLSPGNFVDKVAETAFRYNNDFLHTGYPRNDILHNNTLNSNEIKSKLNISKNKKVLVYAPTWRYKGSYVLPIDLAEVRENLSEEYVFVIRYHHYNSKSIQSTYYDDFIINGNTVSIEELLVISDILITDYSSVMFDYATLNKPFIIYAPDYDQYYSSSRGCYIDIKSEAEEVFCETTGELIDLINKYPQNTDVNKKINIKYNTHESFNGTNSEKLINDILHKKNRS